VTPFEEGVLQDWQGRLQSEEVDQAVIDALSAAYRDTSIPNAEQILVLLRTKASGDEVEA
jgi:hypothetical protein